MFLSPTFTSFSLKGPIVCHLTKGSCSLVPSLLLIWFAILVEEKGLVAIKTHVNLKRRSNLLLEEAMNKKAQLSSSA